MPPSECVHTILKKASFVIRIIDRVILLSHLSSNLLYQGWLSPLLRHIFRCTEFQMYGILFFSLPATFLENTMSEKYWKEFQLFLSVKPVIWAIIRWNPLLGTLRITYCTTSKVLKCTTSKVLKSRFFHFKPRCWRRIWTKNSEKKYQLFLLVKPIIWAIIRWNLLLETLRIAYCTTSKVLKTVFFT